MRDMQELEISESCVVHCKIKSFSVLNVSLITLILEYQNLS